MIRCLTLPLLLISLVLALHAPASAALAPQYQRANEFNAVINAASALFEQSPITQISYQDEDLYLVSAGTCTIQARLVTKPSPAGFCRAAPICG